MVITPLFIVVSYSIVSYRWLSLLGLSFSSRQRSDTERSEIVSNNTNYVVCRLRFAFSIGVRRGSGTGSILPIQRCSDNKATAHFGGLSMMDG